MDLIGKGTWEDEVDSPIEGVKRDKANNLIGSSDTRENQSLALAMHTTPNVRKPRGLFLSPYTQPVGVSLMRTGCLGLLHQLLAGRECFGE